MMGDQATTKRSVDAVFFLPFAAGELEAVSDTIESIERYVAEPHHIYAVDDCSPTGLDTRLRWIHPQVTVLRNDRRHGGRNGLFVTMLSVCERARAEFDFQVFVKMDTDALMVGAGLVTAAKRHFVQHPRIGMLGSYRVRADGTRRYWLDWKLALLRESSPLRRLLGRPVLWRDELAEAKAQGYRLGEHVLGGAYVLRGSCLSAILSRGFPPALRRAIVDESRVSEDVIWSLLCRASGFELGDFGMPEQLIAAALDRVPLPKESLGSHTAVIHSVRRGHDGETESEIRAFFRNRRNAS